jgi:hypothetical protein
MKNGMWRRVDIVLADVSEERIASIFRVEEKKKSASERAWAGATDAGSLVDFLFSSNLKMVGDTFLRNVG